MSLFFGIVQSVNSLLLGLLRKYYFTGNANDTSGNGQNGTVVGATLTTDRKAASNSAYSFNGNEHISLPNNGINGLNSITISLWINPSTSGTYDALIWSRGSLNKILGFLLSSAGTGLLFYLGNGTTSINAITSDGLLSTGSWFHVIGTWESGDYLRIYINDVLRATSSNTIAGPISLDDDIKVGYDDDYASRYFYGKVDDIRIYNRILTTNERSALYNE